MPVAALKAAWPEAEFRKVLAKYRHEMLPGERLDWWGGQILAALIAPHRKKGAPPPDPKKLTPDWYAAARPRKRQTAAGVAGLLRAFTVASGGVVADGRAGSGKPGDSAVRERGADGPRAGSGPHDDSELRRDG